MLRQRSVQNGNFEGSVAGLRQIGHKTGLFIMSYSENLQFKYNQHSEGTSYPSDISFTHGCSDQFADWWFRAVCVCRSSSIAGQSAAYSLKRRFLTWFRMTAPNVGNSVTTGCSIWRALCLLPVNRLPARPSVCDVIAHFRRILFKVLPKP